MHFYNCENDLSNAAVLWPSRDNYERFRVLCDDILPRSFDDFIAGSGRKRRKRGGAGGGVGAKLDFDPDTMAAWCQIHFGRVDATARRFYAAFLMLSRGIGAEDH